VAIVESLTWHDLLTRTSFSVAVFESMLVDGASDAPLGTTWRAITTLGSVHVCLSVCTHAFRRLSNQVCKEVILFHVLVPPSPHPGFFDTPVCLAHISTRELLLRRWRPERNRDPLSSGSNVIFDAKDND
jgi:hypothetical protein